LSTKISLGVCVCLHETHQPPVTTYEPISQPSCHLTAQNQQRTDRL